MVNNPPGQINIVDSTTWGQLIGREIHPETDGLLVERFYDFYVLPIGCTRCTCIAGLEPELLTSYELWHNPPTVQFSKSDGVLQILP